MGIVSRFPVLKSRRANVACPSVVSSVCFLLCAFLSPCVWQEGNDDVTKVQVSEEAQDDLEVAWENLEVARVIFETYKDQVRTVCMCCWSI